MKLNKRAFALTTGILLGVVILVITDVFIIFQHEGIQLAKLHKLFIGYDVTWAGAIIGLAWGFVYGAIGGWIFAWLYNKLEKQAV
jgi:hypothetical protein